VKDVLAIVDCATLLIDGSGRTLLIQVASRFVSRGFHPGEYTPGGGTYLRKVIIVIIHPLVTEAEAEAEASPGE